MTKTPEEWAVTLRYCDTSWDGDGPRPSIDDVAQLVAEAQCEARVETLEMVRAILKPSSLYALRDCHDCGRPVGHAGGPMIGALCAACEETR